MSKAGRWLVLASVIAALAFGGLAIYRAAQPAEWDPVLEPYIAFIEAERGLTFDHPVDVRWADIAQEIADQQAAASRDTSVTIVHELTHALQHQNGLLEFFPESPDSASARLAIIEGDAERIAMAWYWSRTDAERQEYLDAIGYIAGEVFEDQGNSYLETSFYASYGVGQPMVEAIVAADGQEALNELLASEDIGSTERLLDVFGTSNHSGVDALEIMTLPAGVQRPDGDIGVLTWFQTLAPVIGTELTFDALEGYDDDAFAMFRADGEACVRFELHFDTSEDAVEFVQILDVAGIPVEQMDNPGLDAARLDLCDAIGDPGDQRFGTLIPLVAVNELMSTHAQNGLTKDVARCAALDQASTIPIRPSEEFIGWDALIEDSSQYVAACQ